MQILTTGFGSTLSRYLKWHVKLYRLQPANDGPCALRIHPAPAANNLSLAPAAGDRRASLLNCPSPSLASGRSAPTCSDIHVLQAGDDARMPSAPPQRPLRGVEVRLSEERVSAPGRIASAPACRCRLDNTPGTAPGSHNAANIHLQATTEVRFGGRRYRVNAKSALAPA
jgi:hypothetical protein